MNVHQQLADKVKKLTVFCIANRGKCFAQLDAGRLFRYVAFHLLNGNLFAEYDEAGNPSMVIICWPDLSARLVSGEPVFNWQAPVVGGDAIFVAEVIGCRTLTKKFLKAVTEHWPESPRRKLFTFRMKNNTPTLVELNWETIQRFTNYVRP